MNGKQNRRSFLAALGTTTGAVAVAGSLRPSSDAFTSETAAGAGASAQPVPDSSEVDFRYSPQAWQTCFCFPDDPHKSLVSERGELLYGFSREKGVFYFPLSVEFTLAGMGTDELVEQRLEAPEVPIVRTMLRRKGAEILLTTFATNRAGEGRVDNVLMEISSAERTPLEVTPKMNLRAVRATVPEKSSEQARVRWDAAEGPVAFVASRPLRGSIPQNRDGFDRSDVRSTFEFGRMDIQPGAPGRVLFRFPQEGQTAEALSAGLSDPDSLLAEARRFWAEWKPFGGAEMAVPGAAGDFLASCARNILQARELRDGKLTFQVGPANYRGLWIVDGAFLLEAARYLGYDREAQQGLETTWSRQREDGGVFAGGGDAHWKDTAIAMYTLVRQAELSQDWSYFREMQPNLLRALDFLVGLREKAVAEGGSLGEYGLLPKGLGDGGLNGAKAELTNTLWTVAGLRPVIRAAEALGLSAEFERMRQFHDELRTALDGAIREEMRSHPDGFDYLPMLMKEDPSWEASDPRDRPKPQIAQWALSHAIYPGLLFPPDSPVVQGHIRLMQACTQEEVPIETGWAIAGGLWGYNACFVAQVYLWAGLPDLARKTFVGFLNHAAPTYCWREEQPLQGALIGQYVGDMPHNWASAECIRYLRHVLALEDGRVLRLVEGIGAADLRGNEPWVLRRSPTKFGPLDLALEPDSGSRGWKLRYERSPGPVPRDVRLPALLAGNLSFAGVEGAGVEVSGGFVLVDPAARSWTARWKH